MRGQFMMSAISALIVATAAQAQTTNPRTLALPAPDATLTHEFTAVGSIRELSDGRLSAAYNDQD